MAERVVLEHETLRDAKGDPLVRRASPGEAAVLLAGGRGWRRQRSRAQSSGQSGGQSGVPATSDTKATWVDYAVSQGADRDGAESATKADLVDRFGG